MTAKNQRPLPLIVKLDRQPIPSTLGRLLHGDVQVAVTDSAIWLQIKAEDVLTQGLARGLPGNHFWLEDALWLIAVGQKVASERLPQLDWQELRDVLELQMPLAALPGRMRSSQPSQLELRPGGAERPCHAGLFEYEVLDAWIRAAAATRLSRLSVSLSDHWVLVMGSPLPPLPCKYFWQEDRVLIPAGKLWYPSISASQLLEHFQVANNDLLLWVDEQEWTTISPDCIKPLQRSAWRQRSS
jgi:MoxR-vWA-beta-propeller ternary system domain bpX2